MREERKTVDMVRGSKKDLFDQNHPVIRQLKEIPGIIFSDQMEEMPSAAISLKKLFTRKEMDAAHVDCLVLYRIAEGTLRILMALSERGICPGLIEIGDLYVDLCAGSMPVYLTHPERFQLLHFEQDYEWYPEDERIFGDLELFDPETQRKADLRLIYKILVASARGNVKMPPKYTEVDYSELFYKALPDEWKQLFAELPDCGYETVMRMLCQSVEMEEQFARKARERLDERAKQRVQEQEQQELGTEETRKEAGTAGKTLRCMMVLLRTELEECRVISQMLYELQDSLETEAELQHWKLEQAFVFGNGAVEVKPFTSYAPGYRCECEQEIRDYSAGEALIIAASEAEESMRRYPAGELRMYALADGKLKNDRVFRAALSMIGACQEKGMVFRLMTSEDSSCEACLKLKQMMKQQEEASYVPGNSAV